MAVVGLGSVIVEKGPRNVVSTNRRVVGKHKGRFDNQVSRPSHRKSLGLDEYEF